MACITSACWGEGSWRNILTQVLAACMLPGVVVHVLKMPTPAYLARCASPVEVHGFLPHTAFTHLLGCMDVNLYISVSECMPMVVLESLAVGVPCPTSPTSLVYAADAELEDTLVVVHYDNPAAIQAALLSVLPRRDALATRGRAMLDWLHTRAAQAWDAFLVDEREAGDGAVDAPAFCAATRSTHGGHHPLA